MLFFFYDTNDELFLQSPLRPAAVIRPLGFLSPYHKMTQQLNISLP